MGRCSFRSVLVVGEDDSYTDTCEPEAYRIKGRKIESFVVFIILGGGEE